MSCGEPRRTPYESPHPAGHPGENIICDEQSMWYGEANVKSAFGGQLDENNNSQKLIKKESGEDEIFVQLTRTVIYKNQIRPCIIIHLLAKK